MISKYYLQRGKVVPIPGMEFTTTRFMVGAEGDNLDELHAEVERLQKIELDLALPELLQVNDRLATLKMFFSLMAKHPVVGEVIKTEWQKFIAEKKNQ